MHINTLFLLKLSPTNFSSHPSSPVAVILSQGDSLFPSFLLHFILK